jgi:hypothetical protein
MKHSLNQGADGDRETRFTNGFRREPDASLGTWNGFDRSGWIVLRLETGRARPIMGILESGTQSGALAASVAESVVENDFWGETSNIQHSTFNIERSTRARRQGCSV